VHVLGQTHAQSALSTLGAVQLFGQVISTHSPPSQVNPAGQQRVKGDPVLVTDGQQVVPGAQHEVLSPPPGTNAQQVALGDAQLLPLQVVSKQ
jgi:hypothetical protein